MQPIYQPTQQYDPTQQLYRQSEWGTSGPFQSPQHVPTQAVQHPAALPSQQPQFAQQPIQQQPQFAQQPIQQQPQFAQQPEQTHVPLQSPMQQTVPGQFLGQSLQGYGQHLSPAFSTPFQQSMPQQSPQGAGQAGYISQPSMQPMGQSIPPSGVQAIPERMQFSAGQLQQPGFELGMGQHPSVHGLELPASSPLVDILVAPEEITLLADLPGFSEEEIQLQASGNTLHISAIRSEETDEEDRLLQHERLHRFERTITLPVHIDVEQAEASCEDGVCRITLPKSEEMKEQSIAFQ